MTQVGFEAWAASLSRRGLSVVLLAVIALVLAVVAVPGRAGGQEGGAVGGTSAASTTTSSTSTPAHTPGSSTTTTPGSTTTTTEPPPAPEPEDDAPPEEVPSDEVVIPPSDAPVKTDAPAPVLQETAAKALEQQNLFLAQAMAAASAAAQEAARLDDEAAGLEEQLAQLQGARKAAVDGYREVRERLRDRAVAAYTGTPSAEVNHVLASEDVNQLVRRAEMLRSVAEADRTRLDDYASARRTIGGELESVVSRLEAARTSAAVARQLSDGYAEGLARAQSRLSGAEVGGGIVAAGFVFPVAGKRWFSDTWGAPRMPGTAFEHKHQGTDIFADTGTPLVACERGVVIRMGTDTLGGTKLWLVGASGTRYYYAHLSAFAEGIHDGLAVEAGTVVGYVGNTGNARTTPPHLHFQVHPGGGAPINPYPMLKIVDDAVRALGGP